MPSMGWDLEVLVLEAQLEPGEVDLEVGEEPQPHPHQASLITTTGSPWDSRATRVSRPLRDRKSEVGWLDSFLP